MAFETELALVATESFWKDCMVALKDLAIDVSGDPGTYPSVSADTELQARRIRLATSIINTPHTASEQWIGAAIAMKAKTASLDGASTKANFRSAAVAVFDAMAR